MQIADADGVRRNLFGSNIPQIEMSELHLRSSVLFWEG